MGNVLGKMKTIFPIIEEHAEVMLKVIGDYADTNQVVEAQELANKYGVDTMGSCSFGFEINTLSGGNADFRQLVKNLLSVNWKWIVEKTLNHDFLKLIRFRKSDPKVENHLRNLVINASDYRQKNNIERTDIFYYVDQLTNKEERNNNEYKNGKFTKEQMFRQLYSFFMGGFGTSSSLISFVLLELSKNQHIQDKLRQNLQENMNELEKFAYEVLMRMEYLDSVVNGKCDALSTNMG